MAKHPHEEPLTEEQANAMLERLSRHFKQPVKPIEQYCDAFRTWQRVLEEQWGYANDNVQAISRVNSLISKSCLLARLLYGDEKLRTVKCPIHDGKWFGIEWGVPGSYRCPYKCQSTGWVIHPDDEAKLFRDYPTIEWPAKCELCQSKYEKDDKNTYCSSFFHCCRDCLWLEGEVWYPCADHIEAWIDAHRKHPWEYRRVWEKDSGVTGTP